MSATNQYTKTDRAFVLGIDGVPWDRIHRWIEAGELPNFKTLADEGVGTPLRSTTPPTTPTAWPSIATGVWPDKHGIYGFQKLNKDYTQQMNTSADRTQPALWDLLSPSLVGNVPMTFPASSIDGTMVSGMISPKINRRATHPPEFASEIETHIPNYEIGLNWQQYSGEETRFRNDLTSLVDARRALMNRLMETDDWRLFFFVYTAPDRLQHLIWDDDVMLEHYRQLDDILGEVIEYTDQKGANLFVVSDHGFGPISKFVNLSAVLENEGYLSQTERTATRGSLDKLGITKSTILGTIRKLGIDDGHVVDTLPKPLVDRFATQVPGDHGLYDVDFSETVAFAHGPSHVYINDTERFEEGIVSPAEIPSIKRELMSIFSAVTDPETGETVLTVSDGDELFPTDTHSPDIVAVGQDGYEEKTKLANDVFESAGAKAASHRSEGVFFARGPSVKSRELNSIPDLSVVDVAPTILHSVGEPIPETVDGEVSTACLAANNAPTMRAVSQSAVDDADAEQTEDFDDVEDRLRGLGYME